MKDEESDRERSKSEEEALWRSYFATRDPEIRARLIELHLATAHKLAAQLYAHRPDRSAEFGDYLQYACVGLVESLDRYDGSRGASFMTFASYRIRGAILNGLEQSTERTAQSAYRRQVEKERVDSLLDQSSAGGDPFEGLIEITIEMALGFALQDSGLADGGNASDPYRSYELKRLRERLLLIVEALPERERRIIKWHYFDHLDFKVIGAVLELSKGRVSQLHARALKLIRKGLESIDRFDLSL
jgi:RNA polymerase sigma factor for flagellar operon FliA